MTGLASYLFHFSVPVFLSCGEREWGGKQCQSGLEQQQEWEKDGAAILLSKADRKVVIHWSSSYLFLFFLPQHSHGWGSLLIWHNVIILPPAHQSVSCLLSCVYGMSVNRTRRGHEIWSLSTGYLCEYVLFHSWASIWDRRWLDTKRLLNEEFCDPIGIQKLNGRNTWKTTLKTSVEELTGWAIFIWLPQNNMGKMQSIDFPLFPTHFYFSWEILDYKMLYLH